jgi:hypothetical protein
MLVAIGALLGIPLWILIGWLAAGLWHRHEINQLPETFKTKVRTVSGTYRHTGDTFPPIAGRAVWAHDVLIQEEGLLIPRTLHFKILGGVQPAQPADPNQVKGLGDSPVTLQLRLDHGAIIEVAALGEDSARAQGPFFADTTLWKGGREITTK